MMISAAYGRLPRARFSQSRSPRQEHLTASCGFGSAELWTRQPLDSARQLRVRRGQTRKSGYLSGDIDDSLPCLTRRASDVDAALIRGWKFPPVLKLAG